MTHRKLLVSAVLALISLLCSLAFAQYGASIQGTVTDKSGAVVSGAKVTVTNEQTGVTQTTTTTGTGLFRTPGLPPGSYTALLTVAYGEDHIETQPVAFNVAAK